MDRTPSDILREAAGLLGEKGWCQHLLREPNTGAMCALGAIGVAEARDVYALTAQWGARPERSVAARWLQRSLDSPEIAKWNNAEHRTAEEVIKTLLVAADEYDDVHSHV